MNSDLVMAVVDYVLGVVDPVMHVMTDALAKGRLMRLHQKEYFRTRAQKALTESKMAEAAFDKALESVSKAFDDALICTDSQMSMEECDRLDEVYHKTKAALALPRRQCDVGTFEEQRKRFKVFCRDRQYGLCDGCPVVRSGFCTLQWAQMPYEGEVAK